MQAARTGAALTSAGAESTAIATLREREGEKRGREEGEVGSSSSMRGGSGCPGGGEDAWVHHNQPAGNLRVREGLAWLVLSIFYP